LVGKGGVEDTAMVDVCSSWLVGVTVLSLDAIFASISNATGPAMFGGFAWGDDRREKGEVSIPLHGLLGEDGILCMLVDIGGVDGIVDWREHWLMVCSSSWRVLILLEGCWKSTSNSGVWRSSSFTHESCVGEDSFHLTRYCFFFQQP